MSNRSPANPVGYDYGIPRYSVMFAATTTLMAPGIAAQQACPSIAAGRLTSGIVDAACRLLRRRRLRKRQASGRHERHRADGFETRH